MSLVQFSSDNALGDCPGFFVQGGKIGVIVLQAWWGMNQQIKEKGADISRLGNYTILVPDLYRGKVAIDNETARHYSGDLDWPGAVKDIQGAAKYLLANGCSRVGVTGFCMGGALSLAAAVLVPEIGAAAPFYGIPTEELCDVTKISVPLQCHFAEHDKVVGFSSPKDYEALKEKLTSAGVKHEFHTYDAGHAFVDPSNPAHNKDLAKLAMDRLVNFFNTNLA